MRPCKGRGPAFLVLGMAAVYFPFPVPLSSSACVDPLPCLSSMGWNLGEVGRADDARRVSSSLWDTGEGSAPPHGRGTRWLPGAACQFPPAGSPGIKAQSSLPPLRALRRGVSLLPGRVCRASHPHLPQLVTLAGHRPPAWLHTLPVCVMSQSPLHR